MANSGGQSSERGAGPEFSGGRSVDPLLHADPQTLSRQRLIERLSRQERNLQAAREEVAQLRGELKSLREEFTGQLKSLREELREAKTQAAPFRRRKRGTAAQKKKPGRKKGHQADYRRVPEVIDETIQQPLPAHAEAAGAGETGSGKTGSGKTDTKACGCPHCGRRVHDVRECVQVIEELPITRPRTTRLTTHVGDCPACGEVRSTHPLQTSTAAGAAGTHLGPRAQALAVSLVHESGLTTRKACGLLKRLCGLKLSPGGLTQLLHRAAEATSDWKSQIERQIKDCEAVYADETGWWLTEGADLGGPDDGDEPTAWRQDGSSRAWLWVFTSKEATLYHVDPERSTRVITETLGENFGGVLVSDCLRAYDSPGYEKHKCIAHHLKVLGDHQQKLAAEDLESEDLALWRTFFRDALELWRLRPRSAGGRRPVGLEEFRSGLTDLEMRRDELLDRGPPEGVDPGDLVARESEKFRRRLGRHRGSLLGCLTAAARGVEVGPTNNRAERDLRPAVISRKLSGGNRTLRGLRTWQTLRSVVVTSGKQGLDAVEELTDRLTLTRKLANAR